MAATLAFGALHHRNFRLYFTGQVISLVGWWMHMVAQPWLVLTLTDSAFYVGLTTALGTVPITVFALFGGAVADRFPKRLVVITTQATAMLVAAGLAWVVMADVVVVWHVLVAAALFGLVLAFDIPVRQAFLVDLVGKRDLMSAIALNSSAFSASRVVGPALGGVLIGSVGIGLCFLVNSVSYIAVLVALLLLRVENAPAAPASGGSGGSRVLAGLAFARREPRIRTLVLCLAVASVFGFSFQVLVPVLARETLGLGADAYGGMVSAAGVGAFIGAVGLAAIGHRVSRGWIVSVAPVLFGATLVALGLVRSYGAVLLILVVIGFTMILYTATTNTLMQTIAPDELRGRIVSVYTFAFIGLSPLGALLAGAVGEQVGAATMMVVGGAVCTVVSAVAMWKTPSLRAAE